MQPFVNKMYDMTMRVLLLFLIVATGTMAAQPEFTTPADWALTASLPVDPELTVEERSTIIGKVITAKFTIEEAGNRWAGGKTSFAIPMVGLLQQRTHDNALKHMLEQVNGEVISDKPYTAGDYSGRKYVISNDSMTYHTVHLFAKNSFYYFTFAAPNDRVPEVKLFLASISPASTKLTVQANTCDSKTISN